MSIIKEFLKKAGDVTSRLGLGLRYEESKEKKMTGQFFVTLNHNDGTIEEFESKNVIVDSASLLIARLLADGQTSLDPSGPNHGIRVLAVGTGDPLWDPNNPPQATPTQEQLEAELARKRFANVTFIKTDGSGLPASEITNIVDYQTVFSESEAVGPIVELGLFGGGTGSEDVDNSANAGTMVNYRTIAVINKPNTATMSIVFRITT
ncbi:hypothetical protein N9948_01340 [bacterium]|nr:hypothetical protein [bacterium]